METGWKKIVIKNYSYSYKYNPCFYLRHCIYFIFISHTTINFFALVCVSKNKNKLLLIILKMLLKIEGKGCKKRNIKSITSINKISIIYFFFFKCLHIYIFWMKFLLYKRCRISLLSDAANKSNLERYNRSIYRQ